MSTSTTASRRSRVWRRLAGGLMVAAAATAITIALWPESRTDQARDDGTRIGQAVNDLRSADSYQDVDNAMSDLRHASSDARDHLGDAVSDQLDRQSDALSNALDGFVGERTTDNGFDADLYSTELNTAIDDLSDQANDFRTNAPDVTAAFWDGVESGLNG